MDEHTLNLLGALAIGYSDLQSRVMGQAGLTPSDLAALLAIHVRPDSSIRDVAAATGLTHSGAVRVIDRLAVESLVQRATGLDRREVAVRCTKLGREKAKHALSLRREMLENATSCLSERDVRALRRVAGNLLAQLPKTRQDAWRICRLCNHGVCRGAECPVGSAVP